MKKKNMQNAKKNMQNAKKNMQDAKTDNQGHPVFVANSDDTLYLVIPQENNRDIIAKTLTNSVAKNQYKFDFLNDKQSEMRKILNCKKNKIRKIVVIGHGDYDEGSQEIKIEYKNAEQQDTRTKLTKMIEQLNPLIKHFDQVTQVRFQICNLGRGKVSKQNPLTALAMINKKVVAPAGREIKISAPKYLSYIECIKCESQDTFMATDLHSCETFREFKKSR